MGVIWCSAFLLGVAVFAPLESLVLCVDYYDASFPGQQVAVKLSATYDAMLTLTQIICYCWEGKLRQWSSHRIVVRHMAVATLLVMLVLYDQVLIGGAVPAPSYALGVLVVFTAAMGLLDGISIGAVYGEAGIVGPAAAHAVVAGHACGFLLLVILRMITKAVLPDTTYGLRLSFCIYFGVTGGLVLSALAAYLKVILPAVQVAVAEAEVEETEQGDAVPGMLHLAAAHKSASWKSADADLLPLGARLSAHGRVVFAPGASFRGMALSTQLVHTGLPRSVLRRSTTSSISSGLLSQQLSQLTSSRGGTFKKGVGAVSRRDSVQVKGPLSSDVSSDVGYKSIDKAIKSLQPSEAAGAAAAAAATEAAMAAAALDPAASGPTAQTAEGVAAAAAAAAAASAEQITDSAAAGDAGSKSAGVIDGRLSSKQQEQQQQKKKQRRVRFSSSMKTLGSKLASKVFGESSLPEVASPFEVHGGAYGDLLKVHQFSVRVRDSECAVCDAAPAGLTSGQVQLLKRGTIRYKDIVQLDAPPPAVYCKPGLGVLGITRAVMRHHWPYALGVVLSYLVSFLLFPAVLGYVEWPVVGSWYPLLLQLADGLGDLSGKLLPIWSPVHPHATITVIGCSRLLFIPVFILGLLFSAGPVFFFVFTFLVNLTAWYEAMIFSLACEGLHPDDAYQVESLLAFMVQVGSLSGALLSLLLELGPWAHGEALEW